MPDAGLTPELRRAIVVGAHRRRTGRLPAIVHSLGTGESARIAPLPDGFRDEETGEAVRMEADRLILDGGRTVTLRLDDDVAFSGVEEATSLRFTGRAGGGSSVTLYAAGDGAYYQYAVAQDV